MTEETNNLIIGAVISLLSALLTFILTSVYQLYKDNRDRKWDLEDRKLQRRLGVLDTKLQDVINTADKHFDVFSKLFEIEIEFIIHEDLSKYAIEIRTLAPMLIESAKTTSSLFNLKDDELSTKFLELADLIANEIDVANTLRDKFANGEIFEKDVEKLRAIDFFAKATNLKLVLTKRIDELSGFDN